MGCGNIRWQKYCATCIPVQVHAEQFLVINALLHGECEIRKLAVTAAPCGHCRQFYSELACAVRQNLAQPRTW
jgi:cytidine deaminase